MLKTAISAGNLFAVAELQIVAPPQDRRNLDTRAAFPMILADN
jgi:hypothetical protein